MAENTVAGTVVEDAVPAPTSFARCIENPLFARGAAPPGKRGLTVVPLAGAARGGTVSSLAPDVQLVETPQGLRVLAAGQGAPHPAGAPDLPRFFETLEGDATHDARIHLESTSYIDIPVDGLAPVPQPTMDLALDGSRTPGVNHDPDPAIYDEDAFWPDDLVNVTEAWLGTRKVTRIGVQPVQYNPVTKTLRYHYDVTATLVYEAQEDAVIQGASLATTSAADTPVPFECSNLGVKTDLLPPMNGNASDFALRRAGAEVDALYKIEITAGGTYRLTQPELIAAGLDAGDLVGDDFRMFNMDREIAIHVSTTGTFGPGDFMLFHAYRFTGEFTGQNQYWLGLGGPGLRMAEVAEPPAGGVADITTHFRQLIYAPNNFYTDSVAPLYEDWDHYRADPLLSSDVGVVLSASGTLSVDFPAAGTAKICATLHGRTANDHQTVIDINGQTVANFFWSGGGSFGGSHISDSAVFPASILTGPTSTFEVREGLTAGGFSQADLEGLSVIYPRQLRATGDRFVFLGQAGDHNYAIDGFGGTDLWVLDTTDQFEPVLITGFATSPTVNGFQLRFHRDSAAAPFLWATRDAGLRSVDAIEEVCIRGLADTDQQADYIMICPETFRAEAYRLLTNRYLKGMSVVVAPPEDIYNEFGYGIRDADAIRQFLGYAFHHWQAPAPQAVVLIGDASNDPHGYLHATDMDIVPAFLGGTPFNYTSADARYGQVNGTTQFGETDSLPDMAIGRIPVRTETELQDVVDKILAHEAVPVADPSRKRGVIVAGNENPPPSPILNFTGTGDSLDQIMQNGSFTSIQKVYAPSGGTKTGVLNAINDAQGRFCAAYFGHGAHFFWNTPELLSTSDLGSFANTRLPIFTATTCINGYYLFPDAAQECLAEELLELPGVGGIGVLAGTALSQDAAAGTIALGFYESLLVDEVRTLGEALLGGYLEAFSNGFETSEELAFYFIFGDPGLVANPQTP